MKKSIIVGTLLGCFITNGALATTAKPDWAWVGTLSAGAAWEVAGNTQTFYLTPEIEKTYKANRPTHGLFDGELFLGVQKNLSQIFQGQIGIAGAVTSDANLSGDIWDDADPQFDNFDYKYKVQHSHVALKGKLLADTGFWLKPWISGSLGVGFNRAHAFYNTPTIFEAVQNPNFDAHTQTAFTYTVGAGVEKELNEHWQVGLGYEFADWGRSRLNRAPGQTLNSGLSLSHLYTNGVLLNITFVS